MKKQIAVACALCACASLAGAAGPATSTAKPKQFIVYDNMHYKGKPDTADSGLLNCNIIYDMAKIWKDKTNRIPDETAFKELVQDRARKPGPIVIDIEGVHDFHLFLNLVNWAHEAVPGCVVGYYGHGLFPEEPRKEQADDALKLAAAVDAFFPSMYTFDDKRDAWKKKLTGLLQQAHRIAPGKPVYPYIWPQYHEGTPKALQVINGNYWKFQLETARTCGANGVVLWSSSKPPWDDDAAWWQVTLKFATEKRK